MSEIGGTGAIKLIGERYKQCFEINKLHHYLGLTLSHISTLEERVRELQSNFDAMQNVSSDQTEEWLQEHKKLEQAEARLEKPSKDFP